jgi:hypothetical protein
MKGRGGEKKMEGEGRETDNTLRSQTEKYNSWEGSYAVLTYPSANAYREVEHEVRISI